MMIVFRLLGHRKRSQRNLRKWRKTNKTDARSY